MCILITSTAHPDYPLIVLSNRDEYFARPTQAATERTLENGAKIVSPLDLGRPEHGTWIGITSEGRIAMLVNYREHGTFISKISRGILPIKFLSSNLSSEAWYNSLQDYSTTSSKNGGKFTFKDIGGFTLVFGEILMNPSNGKIKPLNIMSNRGDTGKIHDSGDSNSGLHGEMTKLETFSVSNSLFYEPWKKVALGIDMLSKLIERCLTDDFSQDKLVEECFKILSEDTYDRDIKDGADSSYEAKLAELQNSIFIPPLRMDPPTGCVSGSQSYSKFYGTRTQTVILYHRSGKLHYYERDLYDAEVDVMNVKRQHFVYDLKSKTKF